MEKTLHFIGKKKHFFFSLLLLCFCLSSGWSQELVLNGTADEHGAGMGSTTDNADAWDMTPNNTILNDAGLEIPSPYRALWRNDALGAYLEATYNGGNGVDEQPGSTSGGNNDTRGVKLFGDGDPVVSESTRRLYQKIRIQAGSVYTFTMESRAEADGIPTEVFMLNEDITTEVGLENGGDDPRVDSYLVVTDNVGEFTTTTFDFTASTDSIVIYVRALLANDGDTEVFFDNLSLVENTNVSVEDELASQFKVFPNPANNIVQISSDLEINKVVMYDMLGKEVMTTVNDNYLDVSALINGTYLMKITSGESIITKKIVKE